MVRNSGLGWSERRYCCSTYFRSTFCSNLSQRWVALLLGGSPTVPVLGPCVGDFRCKHSSLPPRKRGTTGNQRRPIRHRGHDGSVFRGCSRSFFFFVFFPACLQARTLACRGTSPLFGQFFLRLMPPPVVLVAQFVCSMLQLVCFGKCGGGGGLGTT